MSALRQRAALLARTARPSAPRLTRSYASGGHHDEHHHAPEVEESMGGAFWTMVGVIPASIFVYQISRPSKDGEPTALEKWFAKVSNFKEEWERRNQLLTAAIEQAAHDKHILYYAKKSNHIELGYPEVFQHGSPFNVPAGHNVNLDKVIAHYRQQHLDEEERKAKKLAAAAQ